LKSEEPGLPAAAKGLALSVKNKLTAEKAGDIMCVPYLLAALSFLAAYAEMQMKGNGHMSALGWLADFIVPLGFAACILLFFRQKAQRMPLWTIEGICALTVCYLACGYYNRLGNFTDLGFVVTTVHMAGKISMSALLGYQAYAWDRKKKAAYSA